MKHSNWNDGECQALQGSTCLDLEPLSVVCILLTSSLERAGDDDNRRENSRAYHLRSYKGGFI